MSGAAAGGTIRAVLAAAAERLSAVSETARADAEILLAHSLDRPRSYLLAWPDRAPEPAAVERFERLVARRTAGEPVAYLTGVREFWSMPLAVTPDTLIPRPDTETLVELALDRLAGQGGGRVADLGTGSGAIALAIARERPDLQLVATDASAAALSVARRNARELGIANVAFLRGHWCDPLQENAFRMVVSNPPYIAPGDPHLDRGDLRFEPASALVAADDGLADLRAIAREARRVLQPGGELLLEHGYDQAEAVAALLDAEGYLDIAGHTDLAGQMRVTRGVRP